MAKKVLFVTLHRPDRSPSQRFRFEQYIEFLNRNGFECSHSFLLDAEDDKNFYKPGHYATKAKVLINSTLKRIGETLNNHWDIVFVQREGFMLGTSFFEKQFSKKSKLIFDFDDSIWMHQTGESKSGNKAFYFLKNPEKTNDMLEFADMVFAGNNYLSDHASKFNDNVKIIPTTIDTDEYKRIPSPTKPLDKVCIGWSGSFSTIIHFEHAVPALQQIKKKYGDKVYFQVIGDGNYVNEELGIKGLPWRKDTELKDLSEIDIGLMPLPHDEWTKGKCGLKGLQYMALSIATIMSPVGVNTEIITHGKDGMLADTVEEWVNAISFLVDNTLERERIGAAGRQTVIDRYSVKANEPLYLKYFNEVLG